MTHPFHATTFPLILQFPPFKPTQKIGFSKLNSICMPPIFRPQSNLESSFPDSPKDNYSGSPSYSFPEKEAQYSTPPQHDSAFPPLHSVFVTFSSPPHAPTAALSPDLSVYPFPFQDNNNAPTPNTDPLPLCH